MPLWVTLNISNAATLVYANSNIDITHIASAKSSYYYYSRGINKYNEGAYHEAIIDFDKALKINPEHSNSFYHRGRSKLVIGDNYGAINDFDKAIYFNPIFKYAYALRGLAKEKTGDLKNACLDWQKASELEYEDAIDWLRLQCK